MASRSPSASERLRGALWILCLGLLATAGCSGRLSGSGGGNGGSSQPPDLPELEESETPVTPTLRSGVGGVGTVRLDWVRGDETTDPPPPGAEGGEPPLVLALFFGSTTSDVYDGPPLVDPLPDNTITLTGLIDGTPLVFGLAEVTDTGFVPVGELLTVKPGLVVYVDPLAPAGGDGLTPATAISNPFLAVITAFSAGGGNVWFKEGSYPPAGLPIFPGVHLYGGFEPTFDLALRDPKTFRSILTGAPSQPIAAIQPPAPGEQLLETMVLDGLELDGRGVAKQCLDVDNAVVELRGLICRDSAGPGIRIGAADDEVPLRTLLIDTLCAGNFAEGLSVSGGLDLTVRSCRFETNVQEGLDGQPLIAPDGETLVISLVESRFAGNGSQGLDIDLGLPLQGGTEGGETLLTIDRCIFELNGGAGMLVDVDFELLPAWSADVEIVNVTSRGNGSHGLFLDLDGRAPTLIHGVLCAANGGDGLFIRSEIFPGIATLSASACIANVGAGARAATSPGSNTANRTLLVSHCVFSGNAGGGVVAQTLPAGVTSTVAWLQPTPVQNGTSTGSVVLDDPLIPTLNNLPSLYSDVASLDTTTGELALVAGAPVPAADDVLELGNDDIARLITGFVGENAFFIEPVPGFLAVPARLAIWPAASAVIEDWRVIPGTAAEGAGMAPPGGVPVDAGLLSSPMGGLPGTVGQQTGALFYAARISPALSLTLGSSETVVVDFLNGPLAAASVDSSSVVIRNGQGNEVSHAAFELDGSLQVPAPAGGWPTGSVLELQGTLLTTDGRPLAAPLLIPLPVQP